MTIAVGLSAVKTGFDLIKSVREIVKRQDFDPGEVSARLLELQDLMLDARTALTDAADEKVKLEVQIGDLTRMADFGSEFKFVEGVYWREKFPYCPVCWDTERKPTRLGGPVHLPGQGYIWQCPFHKPQYVLRGMH
jgi:hypothetical protein